MLGIEMRAKIDPRDYDLFVGMDADKKAISHTILDQGAFVKTVTTPNEPGHASNLGVNFLSL